MRNVETADQLACIDEVKADMWHAVPMDRLICGDVGYGKTEIAVRAAFKAVQDGGRSRSWFPPHPGAATPEHVPRSFSGFPVRVAAPSRFQSDKDAKKVVAESRRRLHRHRDRHPLAAHPTDPVQGPRPADRGRGTALGVEHKEHLKALRANVDMLAMSATPILGARSRWR